MHPSAGEEQRSCGSAAAASPVLVLQPNHPLAEGIHQVVMGGIGKTQQLCDQVVVARAKAELAGLQQGSYGMGAADLAACWPHCNKSRYLALEQLTYRRAIGGVFYQHRIGAEPLRFERGQALAKEFDNTRQIQVVVLTPEHLNGVTRFC